MSSASTLFDQKDYNNKTADINIEKPIHEGWGIEGRGVHKKKKTTADQQELLWRCPFGKWENGQPLKRDLKKKNIK